MPFSQAAQAMSVYGAVENPRDTEFRLFAQVTNALISHRNCNDKGTIEAIDWNRRLWLTLQSDVSSEANALSDDLIPTVIDQNPCAHLRMPRDMIFHGWSMRLFQAWQHSATMSS